MLLPTVEVFKSVGNISRVQVSGIRFEWDRGIAYSTTATRLAEGHYDRMKYSEFDPRRGELHDKILQTMIDGKLHY